MTVSDIGSIFGSERLQKRHRDAPLLIERDQYLAHLLDQGTGVPGTRSVARMLLHVVHLMDLSSLRTVDLAETTRASLLWESSVGFYKGRKARSTSAISFKRMALRFLKFHNALSLPVPSISLNERMVADFRQYLKESRGMSSCGISSYGYRVANLLGWLSETPKLLSNVSLEDIDVFLQNKKSAGCTPRTLISFSTALRLFFHYAEIRGWNRSGLSGGIDNPRIMRVDTAPKGPAWKEVRRLLNSPATTPADLRGAAILSLCAIYGLRSVEVINLVLGDLDWIGETLTVRRAKGGRVQQFPLQFEVGEVILRYLQLGRPRCRSRHLFVSLKPPFRPMLATTIWGVVSDRLKRLHISSPHTGGHSLRHACATELLRKGSTLRAIADFLGHTSMKSVSVYAKYDIRSLRLVADFSLAGLK